MEADTRKAIRAVIFDCDGVLFDSTEANRTYYNRVLAHMKRPEMTEDQFKYTHMHTSDESIRFLFADDPVAFEKAMAFARNLAYADLFGSLKIEPYLKPLLAKLKNGFRRSIVTNRTNSMPGLLETFGLERDFDFVITALDVERPKPDPEGLLKVLDRFKLSPEAALYIGDTLVDSQAAAAAGIPFAAYGDPSLPAQYHISSLKALDEILGLPPSG